MSITNFENTLASKIRSVTKFQSWSKGITT